MVRMDPQRRVTLNGAEISIPLPEYKLEKLRRERENEYMEEDQDEDDVSLFTDPPPASSQPNGPIAHEFEQPPQPTARPANDWKHDPNWVRETITHMMPAPIDSTSIATMALQRELNAMLKEQERAKSLKELGWYMPPDFIEDNLYQWIVEIHSFDKDLAIAKDLVQKKVNSLVFEIRFPPSFPHSPPFFRILKPRFLPFIQVGISQPSLLMYRSDCARLNTGRGRPRYWRRIDLHGSLDCRWLASELQYSRRPAPDQDGYLQS